MSGWIAVDLDGTLAFYDSWKGPEHIGDPIPGMVDRVKDAIKNGIEVRIFTARASVPEYIPYVEDWAEKYIGTRLKVTNVKDFKMIEIWDDRARRVRFNMGFFE